MKTTTNNSKYAIVSGSSPADSQSSTGVIRNKLLVTVFVAACSIAATYSAETSAADVYLRKTAGPTNLSSDGSPVTLTQVNIPAGTWIVTAKVNAVNFGAADYVRCRILIGGTQRDAGATLVGNAVSGPTGETGPSIAGITLQTVFTTGATRPFALDCLHDFPTEGMYVDPGASILIVRAPGPTG